jgi:hypothetical protein
MSVARPVDAPHPTLCESHGHFPLSAREDSGVKKMRKRSVLWATAALVGGLLFFWLVVLKLASKWMGGYGGPCPSALSSTLSILTLTEEQDKLWHLSTKWMTNAYPVHRRSYSDCRFRASFFQTCLATRASAAGGSHSGPGQTYRHCTVAGDGAE